MASKIPRTAYTNSNWLSNATAKLQRTIYRQAEHKFNLILVKLKKTHKYEVDFLEKEINNVENLVEEREKKIKDLEDEVTRLKSVDLNMSNTNTPATRDISVAYKIINKLPDEVEILQNDDDLIEYKDKNLNERPKKKRRKKKIKKQK